MTPMSPAKLPSPAAFKLLSDLNEFLAVPAKDRAAALKDYMSAADQREVALEEVSGSLAKAQLDLAAATETKREAGERGGTLR